MTRLLLQKKGIKNMKIDRWHIVKLNKIDFSTVYLHLLTVRVSTTR